MDIKTPWQVLVFVGALFIIVRLMLELLLPLGLALVVVGLIAYFLQGSKPPRIKR